MPVTLPKMLCRIATLFSVAAAAGVASAQSYYHAPPRDSPLLPIIQPAFRAHNRPTPPVSPPPAITATETAAPGSETLPQVPAHLTSSVWKRLPTPESSVAAGSTRTASQLETADADAERTASLAGAKPTPDPDHLRSIASRSLARGDIAAAEAQLAAAVQRFPNDLQLAISLARVRETRNDWAGAVEAFNVVISLDPSEARWMTRRAECHYFSGNFEAALNDYLAAETASAPLSVSEYIHFGDAALRTNRLEIAESAFRDVSRLTKDPLPQVELLRGLVALKQGSPDHARTILVRASSMWPNDSQLTEALRIASATRREAEAQIARVRSNQGLDHTAASTEIADTRREGEAPVVSGWRPTRPATSGAVQPASGEIEGSVSPLAVAPLADEEDGWHATSKPVKATETLQPDDGALLAIPEDLSEPSPLP